MNEFIKNNVQFCANNTILKHETTTTKVRIMKQATFTKTLLFSFLLFTSNAFSQNYWETIIPEPWTKYVPSGYRFINQSFGNADYQTGSTPFTGNIAVPPYVIERVEGDESDGIMMITEISGGFHGGGWITKALKRSGHSEQLEAGGPDGVNDNFYGAFYNADIDTLRLPQSIKEIGALAFEEAKVKVLICGSLTPPKLGLNTFIDASMHVLIVPTGCREAYQEAEYWDVFSEIKEGAEKYMFAQLIEKDGAWYQLSEDKTVSMINSDDAGYSYGKLIIPDEVEFNDKSYPVTTLGPASINRYSLRSLTLGANITHFAPSYIQTSHFRSDSYSWETSKNTVKLQEIHVSPDNNFYSEVNGGLYTKDGTTLVYLPYVCENVISGLSSERYYTIPDGVTTIKTNAFPKYFAYNYYDRRVNAGTVVIPPSVIRIEEQDIMYGFHFKFTSETPPEITGFGSACKSAFYVPEGCLYTYLDKCSSLNFYESSDKPNIIKLYTSDKVLFWNSSERCYDLSYLVTDQSDVILPSFASYGLMAGNIKTVGKYGSISYGTNFRLKTTKTLRSLTISEGVEEIYLDGFKTLQSVFLPKTLKVIGPYCFRGSKYLENVEIKGDLETIHNKAFYECERLREITLPAKLTHLGNGAFDKCNALSTIRMEASMPPSIFDTFNEWGEYPNVPYSFVFSYPAKEATLYVPANSKNLYGEYPVWKEFGRIIPVGESESLEPISSEMMVNTSSLANLNLTDHIINNVYYNLSGENCGYDFNDQSIFIGSLTDMSQIDNMGIDSYDIKTKFSGIIMKVGIGKGIINLSGKTQGNAQVAVQIGNNVPYLASRTERSDIVVNYDVTENTNIYIYAAANSGSSISHRAKSDNSVSLYGFSVSPGATGISTINIQEVDDVYYTLDGRKIEGKPTTKGIYVLNGCKVVVK